jgi:hypothetical protein
MQIDKPATSSAQLDEVGKRLNQALCNTTVELRRNGQGISSISFAHLEVKVGDIRPIPSINSIEQWCHEHPDVTFHNVKAINYHDSATWLVVEIKA